MGYTRSREEVEAVITAAKAELAEIRDRERAVKAVKEKRQAADDATIALREAMMHAHDVGVSVAAIIDAADVSRATFYEWQRRVPERAIAKGKLREKSRKDKEKE